jgi:response regulator RpfG family c-di-GMP phosphodiesterase
MEAKRVTTAEDEATEMASFSAERADLYDRRRAQLLWLALSLVGLMALALVLLVAYGLEITSSDYTEPLLLIGLLAFVTCTVAYFADKEREQRAENRKLISRLHETAQALDLRVARLNRLSETSLHLAGALDVDQITDLVVDALVAQVKADAASLVLLDKTKGEYLHTRSKGPLAETNGDVNDPLAVAKAAADQAPAIRSMEQPGQVVQQLEAWNRIRGSISAPMKVSNVVGGALSAIRSETFDTEDLNLLTTLANMASKAIESAELHQRLRESYFKTLHALARSLAARDPYSAAHGEAVTWLACRLGAKLGLSDDDMSALTTYCPLHDLGKIGISHSVLLKPDSLSDDEFDAVRQHTVIGESIMQPLDPGAAALALSRSHHERWDGSGYPDRLIGEEIPNVARVVAVADTFHAIVSHRSYRGGAIPATALHEISSLAGTQFDPEVVDAVVSLWETGELAKFRLWMGQTAEGRATNGDESKFATPHPSSATRK